MITKYMTLTTKLSGTLAPGHQVHPYCWVLSEIFRLGKYWRIWRECAGEREKKNNRTIDVSVNIVKFLSAKGPFFFNGTGWWFSLSLVCVCVCSLFCLWSLTLWYLWQILGWFQLGGKLMHENYNLYNFQFKKKNVKHI